MRSNTSTIFSLYVRLSLHKGLNKNKDFNSSELASELVSLALDYHKSNYKAKSDILTNILVKILLASDDLEFETIGDMLENIMPSRQGRNICALIECLAQAGLDTNCYALQRCLDIVLQVAYYDLNKSSYKDFKVWLINIKYSLNSMLRDVEFQTLDEAKNFALSNDVLNSGIKPSVSLCDSGFLFEIYNQNRLVSFELPKVALPF